VESGQEVNPTVPLSQTLGHGTVGHLAKNGTVLGTVVGQYAGSLPFSAALNALSERCPDYVPVERWRECPQGAQGFLGVWGAQAAALGWTDAELFGLHEPPENPKPNYNRLSRYDCRGLLWGLEGCRVVAMSSDTAAITTQSGGTTNYRK